MRSNVREEAQQTKQHVNKRIKKAEEAEEWEMDYKNLGIKFIYKG